MEFSILRQLGELLDKAADVVPATLFRWAQARFGFGFGFEALWNLYLPCDIIVAQAAGHDNGFVVGNSAGSASRVCQCKCCFT